MATSYALIPAGLLDAELLVARPSAPGAFEAPNLVLARRAGREDLLQIDLRELLKIVTLVVLFPFSGSTRVRFLQDPIRVAPNTTSWEKHL